MKRIALILAGAILVSAASAPEGKRWWSYVEALAADQMQGRATGSEAYRKAAQYVAAQFEHDGLKPAGVEGYFQPVKFDGRTIVEAESSLELLRQGRAERLKLGDDATI